MTKQNFIDLTTKVLVKKYYLDYVNNYLTLAAFANDNNWTENQAIEVIKIGRKLNNEAVK